MSRARLLSIQVERFKSYRRATSVELKPLTVVLGRNNGGKSTLIQALLLLKQTLAHPRADVPLHLDGVVEAFSLRELTSGWPDELNVDNGPRIKVRVASRVDTNAAWTAARSPDPGTLLSVAGITGAVCGPPSDLTTSVDVQFGELGGHAVLNSVVLESEPSAMAQAGVKIRLQRTDDGTFAVYFNGGKRPSGQVRAALDHFLPYLTIDKQNVGPRSSQRAWHNAFLILFAQPLDDLKRLLLSFGYLGSTRGLPPTLYKAASVPPEEIGVSGEYAAQMLHARRDDFVRYLPPVTLVGETGLIRSRSLVAAVNDVLAHVGVNTSVNIHDVQDLGFRLRFGKASLQHVGRGLTYLLPVVEYGLVLDPSEGAPPPQDLAAAAFEDQLDRFAHGALEEPEAHLHPKIQSRLAHWLVALAMSGRRLIVETHSDHLVRRLRGLAARAKSGDPLESWLRENVAILEVEQDEGGESSVRTSTLTASGGLENWPVDFMDEATNEERAIYDAALTKTDPDLAPDAALEIEHLDAHDPE
jgi:predicted ATPase